MSIAQNHILRDERVHNVHTIMCNNISTLLYTVCIYAFMYIYI